MQMPRCEKMFFYLVIKNEYFSPFSIVNAKYNKKMKLMILQDESNYDKKTGGYLVVPREAL